MRFVIAPKQRRPIFDELSERIKIIGWHNASQFRKIRNDISKLEERVSRLLIGEVK